MAAIVTGLPALSDDDLLRIAKRNPEWKVERTDDGDLRLNPTHTDGGSKSLEAAAQLRDYAKRAGGKAYDSSTGFKTSKGGVFSPEGAWISEVRVASFSPAERRTYRTVTPDVVIEIRSDTDDWNDVKAKIDYFRADGARYAVAIDLDTHEIYESGSAPPGLALDYDAIFAA